MRPITVNSQNTTDSRTNTDTSTGASGANASLNGTIQAGRDVHVQAVNNQTHHQTHHHTHHHHHHESSMRTITTTSGQQIRMSTNALQKRLFDFGYKFIVFSSTMMSLPQQVSKTFYDEYREMANLLGIPLNNYATMPSYEEAQEHIFRQLRVYLAGLYRDEIDYYELGRLFATLYTSKTGDIQPILQPLRQKEQEIRTRLKNKAQTELNDYFQILWNTDKTAADLDNALSSIKAVLYENHTEDHLESAQTAVQPTSNSGDANSTITERLTTTTAVDTGGTALSKLVPPAPSSPEKNSDNTSPSTLDAISTLEDAKVKARRIVITSEAKAGGYAEVSIKDCDLKADDDMTLTATANDYQSLIPGLVKQEVPGDGHCLYYAVSLYLGTSQHDLRTLVANYLEQHKEQVQGFIQREGKTVDDYIAAVRDGKEWATHVEIEALMQTLGRAIVVIADSRIFNRQDVSRFQENSPIFVAFNGRDHYDAMLLNGSQDARQILEGLVSGIYPIEQGSGSINLINTTINASFVNLINKSEIIIHRDQASVDKPQVQIDKLSNIPFSDASFIGREKELQQLKQRFNASQGESVTIQVLTGNNGVGKTALAMQYARQMQANNECRYDITYWLPADPKLLEIAYREFANQLGVESQKDIKSVIDAVQLKLNQYKRYLLVFDSVKSYEDIHAYLPGAQKPEHHIIVTTQNHSEFKPQQRFSLETFSLVESIKYVQKTCTEATDESGQALHELLGGLPLALSQAVAYIDKNNIDIEEYIKRYNQQGPKLLKERGYDQDRILFPRTVLTNWHLTQQQLDLSMAKLLNLSAYLDADIIPQAWFANMMGAEEFQHSYTQLVNLSLIKKDQNYFYVHRLQQDIIRHEHSDIDRRVFLSTLAQALYELLSVEYLTPENREITQQLLVHAEVVLKHIAQYELEYTIEFAWQLYFQVATVASLFAQYQLSIDYNLKALDILLKQKPQSAGMISIVFGNIANQYKNLGDQKANFHYLKQTLQIQEICYDKNSEVLAKTYTNLAGAYGLQGDANKQLELLNKAESIFLKSQSGPAFLAKVWVNMADAYGRQGNKPLQQKFLLDALRAYEKQYGAEHHALVVVLTKLGDLLQDEKMYNRALLIQESTFGANAKKHPEVARTLIKLSYIHAKNGQHQARKENLEKALAVLHAVHGKDSKHSSFFKVHMALGSCFSSLGDDKSCINHLTDALSVGAYLPKNYTDRVVQLLFVKQKLFLACFRQKNYALGTKHGVEALIGLKQAFGNDHMTTTNTRQQLKRNADELEQFITSTENLTDVKLANYYQYLLLIYRALQDTHKVQQISARIRQLPPAERPVVIDTVAIARTKPPAATPNRTLIQASIARNSGASTQADASSASSDQASRSASDEVASSQESQPDDSKKPSPRP